MPDAGAATLGYAVPARYTAAVIATRIAGECSMTYRMIVRSLVLLLCAGVATDALGARRGVRIDFGSEWQAESSIGSAGCPGTTGGSTVLVRGGVTYSGRDDNAHLVDAYCQLSTPDEWGESSFFGLEPGLAALVGPNDDNAVQAIRYSFLDAERFDGPTGFQWIFYDFPNGLTLVGLYGLIETALTDTSYILAGDTFLWRGTDGYDGEYFCFHDGAYVGIWEGELGDDPAGCLAPLQQIFRDGFE